MAKKTRNYVIRPDGKPINVPRQRGQLFVCENGCCCGHTERGFAPVPHDLYYREWERRKLRNKVHLNHAGCLGPCALANVALLLFDGHPIWFHSINDERLILAIFDYIDTMLAADRYLPPPPGLVKHAFNGFGWTGSVSTGDGRSTEEAETALSVEPVDPGQSVDALLRSRILLLTHADTDLLALERATADLPADFPPVTGLNLLSLPTEAHVQELIRTGLDDVQVVVMRTHGGRSGFRHGFDLLAEAARQRHIDLICVPGTEGLDPESLAYSTVPAPVVHDVYRYLQFGGVDNLRQMLHFLADHLLAGGWGYELPVEQPRHGIYRPPGIRAEPPDDRPVVGILFYRSHYLSGNTDFVDALAAAVEEAGGFPLPVFTTTLKEQSPAAHGSDRPRPAAFDFFYDEEGQRRVDAVICTISFAMGGLDDGGVPAPGWNVDALQALDVPILQAITSGMDEEEWRLSLRGLQPLDGAMNVAMPEFDGRIITVPVSFKANRDPQQPDDGAGVRLKYRVVPDRVQAVARLALRLATLRRKPNAQKRVAFVLTNSPGKADRIGNAVGLDAPASLMRLFARMQAAGYRLENL
ncbi:hypothetical protein RY27_30280, partial [Litorilinea aerophila]